MKPLLIFVLLAFVTPSAPATADTRLACDRSAFTRAEDQRHRRLMADLRASVVERRGLPDGWTFRLQGGGDAAVRAMQWIRLERRCCGFFDFTLDWKGADADPWLTIRGPEGAKDVLSAAWASMEAEPAAAEHDAHSRAPSARP